MKDAILTTLIALAETEKPAEEGIPLELDITLLVGGFLVSGFIISYKKYMDHHPVTHGIESAKEQFNAGSTETPEETYNYIHLRDAKFFHPGGQAIPNNQSIFVRIALDSIHGFSFGKLESEYL